MQQLVGHVMKEADANDDDDTKRKIMSEFALK